LITTAKKFSFKHLIVSDWEDISSPNNSIADELERLRSIAKARFAAVLKTSEANLVVEWSTHEPYGRRLEKVPNLRQMQAIGEPFAIEVKGNLRGTIVGLPINKGDDFSRSVILFYSTRSFFLPRLCSTDLLRIKGYLSDIDPNLVSRQDRLVRASISALLSGETPADPFQTTLELLLKLFRCEQGTIWEFHDNSEYGEASYLTLEGLGNQAVEKYQHNCLKQPLGLVWQALAPRAKQYTLRNDTTLAELVNKDAKEEYTGKPVVLIRLEAGSTIYGVACLTGLKPLEVRDLTPAFGMFQNIAALEIHNKRLERKNRILQKVSEIIPTVSATTATEACQATAHKLRELLEVQAVSVFLKPGFSQGSKSLDLIASSAAPESAGAQWLASFGDERTEEHTVVTGSVVATIIGEGKPMLRNELSTHPFSNKPLGEERNSGAFTWIGVPVSRSGQCVGVLCCVGKQTILRGKRLQYIFDSFDVFVLEDAARMLSPILEAIENFYTLERVNRRLELSERIREHEMKAPLTAISWNAGFVLQYLDDDGAKSRPRRLREIVSDAEMCTFLLREPRIPTGAAFVSSLRHLSIRDLIGDLVSFLQRQIQARSTVTRTRLIESIESDFAVIPFMTIEYQGSAPKTMLSKFLMQRALYNIGINAVKYGAPNGKLSIVLGEESDKISITFSDNGIGINKEDASSIFEEGFRGKNTDGRSGEGLGLRITREIIEAHGGNIRLVSRRGPTSFRVELPIVRSSATKQTLPHSAVLRMDQPVT
jgi:signal transduction histidine kinase